MRGVWQGLIALMAVVFSWGWAGPVVAAPSPDYSYVYRGQLVRLTPSPRYVAVKDLEIPLASANLSAAGLAPAISPQGKALQHGGYTIYHRPSPDKQISLAPLPDLAATTSQDVQPVFEQGWALRIPRNRVLVGFPTPTSVVQALEVLRPVLAFQGILEIQPVRSDVVAAIIDQPAQGRAYAVARAVAELPGVAFAEPDHLVIMQRESSPLLPATGLSSGLRTKGWDVPLASPLESTQAVATVGGVRPQWVTLASLDGEASATLPPAWMVTNVPGTTAAYWGRTTKKSHRGVGSYYCAAAGTSNVVAPGPAPANMWGAMGLKLDLSGYEEVYVEFWFYAVNETGMAEPYLYDFGYMVVTDLDNTIAPAGVVLAANSLLESDMTTDPTTDRGWRKCLFRVPPALRKANVVMEFDFQSDASTRREGLYLDDIRIVGSPKIDTWPLGNDTYAGRQYDLRNVGQIAGLGTTGNDLHLVDAWGLVAAPSAVVAILDDGVDLQHPDLNLVAGYDWNGAPGGGHKSDQGYHGTLCAGAAGARMNAVGVRGSAPDVRLMPVEVLSSGTSDASLASAIDVAVARGAKVLSNSWGWVGAPLATIERAFQDALNAGRVVVCAAGNGPDRSPYTYETVFPATLTSRLGIISVGASSPTDEHKGAASSDGQFHWGSSYVGTAPDVVAPGTWIYTTDRRGSLGANNGTLLANADYAPAFGGTSASTPRVAGIAALLVQANPDLTPAAVKELLRAGADDIDAPGVDARTGAGRVNAVRSILRAQHWHAASWWWNPTKPGTGWSLEQQGNKIYLAWYVYDASGRPVWYASLMDKSGDGATSESYTGAIFKATGWPLGTPHAGYALQTVGQASLTFASATSATFGWSIGGFGSGQESLKRFFDEAPWSGGTRDTRDISGWWLDPAYEGMGIFLEARGGNLYLAWYHYREDGTPRWWSLGGEVGTFAQGQGRYSNALTEWRNGQTPGGPPSQATGTSLAAANLVFNSDGSALLTTGGTTYHLQRFLFGR